MADGMQNLNTSTSVDAVLAALAKATRLDHDPRLAHLNLAKSTFAQPGGPTTGLQFYDLEAGAKMFVPVLTPLRNSIPRVSGKGGVQANWRAVTAINTTGVRVGVSQGHRGGVIAVQTKDYAAGYRGIGLESSADFEAHYAGQGFEDIRALAAKTGLESLMLGEELLLVGGNGNRAFGTTPTPVLAAAGGGSLAAATYSVICVALSLEGFFAATVAGGVPAQLSRTNADGSVDTFGGGSAQKSANATVAVGASGKINATVAAVIGASGYAWYWGAAGSEVLGAITTVPALSISANATGTQTAASLPAADNSVNQLVFDGLIQIAATTASGAYTKDLAGATLTSDGAGGIVEIDAMLQSMWDNYRLSPDEIWVSSQEFNNIGKKILGAGVTPGAFRINIDQNRGAVGGGIMIASYLNKFSMAGAKEISFKLHPNLAPGMILAVTHRLPYPLANVNNVMQVRARQDYYQIEWPLVTRQYQYGVYADEVLQHYFPPSLGIIQGIGNG